MQELDFRDWLVQEVKSDARVKLRDGSRPFNGTSTKAVRHAEKERLKDKLMAARSDTEIVNVVDEILSKGFRFRGKSNKSDIHRWLLENWGKWYLYTLLEDAL